MLMHVKGSQASAVTFTTWTGQRRVTSFGTTAGLRPLAFERWRDFKEAFAPEIVERAFAETPGPIRHVADPFGGSGTTALATQFLGAKPSTIEVNPYLADLIEAKLANYDLHQVGQALAQVCTLVCRNVHKERPLFAGAPKTFIEPGVDGRYIFSREIAARINAYRTAIDQVPSVLIRRLFRVLLGSILIPVSNVVISGKGRRYRGSWQVRSLPANRIDELFQERVLQALYDLRLYACRACSDYAVLRGDCRQLITSIDPIDLAVLSPPYPNSFDYTDVYNVELWALGYLDGQQSNTELRNATLRSHVQVKRDMSGVSYHSSALRRTLRGLREVQSDLWNKHIPDMIGAYFSDMGQVMLALRERLRKHGRIYMVVGESRYAGVNVPVATILEQIAPAVGLTPISSEACRSMRVSPQQGGQEALRETLLVFRKSVD